MAPGNIKYQQDEQTKVAVDVEINKGSGTTYGVRGVRSKGSRWTDVKLPSDRSLIFYSQDELEMNLVIRRDRTIIDKRS